jgi:hypothetical protein
MRIQVGWNYRKGQVDRTSRYERTMMKLVAGTLAVAALDCGLVAAWYSYKSTTVPAFAPKSPEPFDPEQQALFLSAGTWNSINEVGQYTRQAVRWAVYAAILGALSSLTESESRMRGATRLW